MRLLGRVERDVVEAVHVGWLLRLDVVRLKLWLSARSCRMLVRCRAGLDDEKLARPYPSGAGKTRFWIHFFMNTSIVAVY